MNPDLLPACWRYALSDHLASPGFAALRGFVASERQQHDVYPAEDHVFRAFTLTPLAAVRVVILGQDPYHGPGQAHGLSFSVPEGVRIPPSLRNLFKELQSDVGTPPVTHGCLEAWARQGVLLLNTVLTVRSGQAHSHRRQGWEAFTESVLRAVGQTAAYSCSGGDRHGRVNNTSPTRQPI